MSAPKTFQALAAEAGAYFITRTRANDSTYVTCTDAAPAWVRNLVRDAHGEFLPEDWRYEQIRSALATIAEHDGDPSDVEHEFRDAAVSVYSSDLLAWLASNTMRPGYCDQAADDLGATPPADIMASIALGQDYEAAEIFALVVAALQREQADRDA